MVLGLTPSHICLEFCHIKEHSIISLNLPWKSKSLLLRSEGKSYVCIKILPSAVEKTKPEDNCLVSVDALVLSSPHKRERKGKLNPKFQCRTSRTLSWVQQSHLSKSPEIWGVRPNITPTTDTDITTTTVMQPLRLFSHLHKWKTRSLPAQNSVILHLTFSDLHSINLIWIL